MPRYDWNPQRPIFMDLETQSALNLRAVGSRPYLRHSSTRILSAVFLWDDQQVVWIPSGRAPSNAAAGLPGVVTSDDVPQCVCDAVAEGGTFVAHNAEHFDALAWEWLLPQAPQPTWYDTVHACRAAGLPAGLDRAARALGFSGKHERGKDVIRLLCTAKQRGSSIVYPVGTLPLWKDLIAYNVQDVILLREIYEATKDYGEADVLAVHSRINQRGVPVDLQLASRLRQLWVEYQEQAKCAVAELTDNEINGDSIRSVPKVRAWLKRQGFDASTLNRKDLEVMMADPDGFFGDSDDPIVSNVRAVILQRQAACRSTVGKVERVFAVVDEDSRCRGQFNYWGASTGRWSGRDLQPHNMPRGVDIDVEGLLDFHDFGRLTLDRVKEFAEAKRVDTGDALSTLMRPVVRARPGHTLVIVDYATVEARGVAWVAREQRALDTFADHTQDIYCDMASKLFGRAITKKYKAERQLGKTVILGCGYGMGANKFGAYCRLGRVDLAAADLTAEQCVQTYRESYPAIPAVWKAYQKAVDAVLNGTPFVVAGRCVFAKLGDALTIRLPSGREIVYRNVRKSKKPAPWNPALLIDSVLYDSPQGFPKTLYGGLITENIVQGMCRDFLADAMVRLDPVYPVVLHVHDEPVMEVPQSQADDALRNSCAVMSCPPTWAADFPLRVEGFTCEHYVKSAWSTSYKADYMRGVALG